MNITEMMRLLQFGDSLLPVGSFSFSNGLEAAIQQRIVYNLDTLSQFVHTAAHQAASADGIALLETHRAAREGDMSRILVADHAVFNLKLNEEMRLMSVRMGKKFAEMGKHVLPAPLLAEWLANINQGKTPGTYPVGLGILFAEMGQSEEDAFAVQQYGVAMMILGASMRLMKVNHLDTQAILFQVNATSQSQYARVANATLDDMATFAPLFDILAATHVKGNIRMFMS